jgi:tetratricopeptide (TPR) repeat protein
VGLLDSLFGGGKRRAAVASALRAAASKDLTAALGCLANLPAADRADALCELADHYGREEDGASARSMVARALDTVPEHRAALERLLALESESRNLDAAIAACARLVRAAPKRLEPVCTLADLLLAVNRPADALAAIEESPHSGEATVVLKRGECLLALDRDEEALEILSAVRDHFYGALKAGLLSREDWHHVQDLHGEASRLADSAQAALHGRESVVVDSASSASSGQPGILAEAHHRGPTRISRSPSARSSGNSGGGRWSSERISRAVARASAAFSDAGSGRGGRTPPTSRADAWCTALTLHEP